MSSYYFPVFDDLHKHEQYTIIIDILENVIIPNIPKDNQLEWCDVISNGYFKAKQYKKSIKWGEKALSLSKTKEQKYSCRFNLIQTYINVNFPEKSKEYSELNLQLNPDDWEMKLQYAISLFALNKKDETFNILKELSKRKDLPIKTLHSINFNMGIHYIANGDFKLGMRKIAIGRMLNIWGSHTHNYPIPQWTGRPEKGKSILFVGEGGIGDEFIFARFVKHVRDMEMIPHIASAHENATIFKRMGFETTRNYKKFTTDIDDIENFDYWVPIMDLAFIMDLDFNDLWYGPYTTVDIFYDEKWKEILPKNDKLKIGLKWSGNPLYEQDLHRTIPIKDIISHLNTYELISLQKENSDELIANKNIIHLNDKLETIEDLIGAISQLDIVITSCTSIAHIAASMGKRTFVMVPLMSYYIWSEKGNKTSWYGDNVTILKQQTPRVWNEPIGELIKLL